MVKYDLQKLFCSALGIEIGLFLIQIEPRFDGSKGKAPLFQTENQK
jgi:hypothetical protein